MMMPDPVPVNAFQHFDDDYFYYLTVESLLSRLPCALSAFDIRRKERIRAGYDTRIREGTRRFLTQRDLRNVLFVIYAIKAKNN